MTPNNPRIRRELAAQGLSFAPLTANLRALWATKFRMRPVNMIFRIFGPENIPSKLTRSAFRQNSALPPGFWRSKSKPGAALTLTWRYRHNERSEEHTSELQSRFDLVCRLL